MDNRIFPSLKSAETFTLDPWGEKTLWWWKEQTNSHIRQALQSFESMSNPIFPHLSPLFCRAESWLVPTAMICFFFLQRIFL